MPPNDVQSQDCLSNTSRRGLLKRAALALTGPVLARARQKQLKPTSGRILAYAGAYGSPRGPQDSKGNLQGVYLFEMNPATGELSPREQVSDVSSPAWLAFDPTKTHLYVANEIANFQGTMSGSVSAFTIDRSNGRLALLNAVSSQGAGPAHLSVHPSGRYVLVANYGGGSVAVLPIRSNGELGSATDFKQDQGAVGPPRATNAPPGSFAISGHEGPHTHMIQADPSGRFVLVSDLGMDQICIWAFDANKGTLSNPTPVPLPPGDGPRHFVFHPNGRWLYSLQEESSTMVLFDFDAFNGRLTAKQTASTLPKVFVGTNFTSEVMVSSDGKFVYAANRLHNSVAFFSVGAAGALTLVGEEWTRGDYPSNFNIDPTGNFLYACNERSDAITTFRIDRIKGHLTFTGQYMPVASPTGIVFLA
jgi:6-phosphogluconolactonase